ncbi:fused MFS/spermidine synthase [Desulfovibrio sp. OttesenSCG-928-M14]|nr:fused MFS/spermidine synthase [Desulfovibrio sp. OttesenSCG-928-M14]
MLLALVVFLNGAAVMVLEMAGARLLAPELGTSVVVWTSIIGVILASLSLGYWLGGRLADSVLRETSKKQGKGKKSDAGPRDRAFVILANLLMLASISVFITAALGTAAPGAISSLFSSLHLSTIITALTLFALPSTLCGMVSPYAVRLGITSSDSSGAVIGRLNAIATVGSIVGTFLGGFVLLSWFSTGSILLGVACCLLGTAVLVRARPVLPKAVFGILLVAAMIGNAGYADWVAKTGFYEENIPLSIETSYSSMRVAKGRQYGRDALLLLTDPGSAQSGMYVDDPNELMFDYTRFYALGTALNPDAKRILMLGGGGYSVPKWLLAGRSGLASDDFSLDVVELDPGMTRTAAAYFKIDLDDPRLTVFHEDARTFVNRAAAQTLSGQNGPYDLIFADIFNSWYTVPFHVGTREAAQKIRSLLAEDGVYIMNIISAISGDNGRLLRSIRLAFMESFEQVDIFPVQQRFNGGLVQNVMLMARRGQNALPDPEKQAFAPHVAALLQNRWSAPFPAPDKDVFALTDAFAPVERYTLGFLD